ncbi:DUF2933 family protein [Streptomyces sp. SLBN-118]|uniref:DUF2933 domain-containing protein n=1 Tax=Streptomyces sp. SLBN-118 TaxID=2768454 RepID=UPI00114DF05D|nr:DUF2933 domain-containing protein [Streptomyces sp. SLBN-118]TQK49977.1 DUF2933 family protein [Streptomyces sp. SLBN-118]
MSTSQRNYGLYAIALAIVVVSALALGVPVGTLVLLGVVMVCPLMMFFMMRGMHGGHRGSGQDSDPTDRLRKHDRHASGRP